MTSPAPTVPAPNAAPLPAAAGTRPRASAWARFRRARSNRAAAWVVGALVALAVLADLLASDLPLAARLDGRLYVLPNLTKPAELRSLDLSALRSRVRAEHGDWLIAPPVPFGPYRTDLSLTELPAPPSREHWLGTDETGRDVLARLIHASRTSLAVSLLGVGLYVLIGLLLGALAGYRGGAVDFVVSRATEVMLAFPTLLLVICALALLERPGLQHLVLVLGLTGWPEVARLVRAEVMKSRSLDYVHAARGLGLTSSRILVRHVLPNAAGPVLVSASLGMAGAALAESALSFLGLGVPAPMASWGELLAQAHRYVSYPGAWWLALFPGLALTASAAAYNRLGEGLRDAMDPRLGSERRRLAAVTRPRP